MLKFTSGHCSEQSTANHSSRPTALIAAEMWLRNYIKLILESPPQKTKISTLVSFKTRIKWPLG